MVVWSVGETMMGYGWLVQYALSFCLSHLPHLDLQRDHRAHHAHRPA